MRWFLPFALMSVAMAASNRKLKCHKIGLRSQLYGHNGITTNTTLYSVDTHGMEANKSQGTKFQMYECDAPSSRYPGGYGGTKTGQLRLANDDTMCLTVARTAQHENHNPQSTNFSYTPNDASPKTMLSQCASRSGSKLSQQWVKMIKGSNGCPARIAVDSLTTDVTQDRIKSSEAGIYFDVSTPDRTAEYAYLSFDGHFSKNCE